MKLFRSLLFLAAIILIYSSCTSANRAVRGRQMDFPALERLVFLSPGKLEFTSPGKLEFFFNNAALIPPNASLIIEYDFNIPVPQEIKDNFRIMLDMKTSVWELPMDMSFLRIERQTAIRYSVPLEDSFSGSFSITLESDIGFDSESTLVLQIKSYWFSEKKFGFWYDEDKSFLFVSPFTSRGAGSSFIINVPDRFFDRQVAVIEATFDRTVTMEIAGRKIETLPGLGKLQIPSAFFSASPGRVTLSGDGINSFIISFSQRSVFPEPIIADPALVLEWPRENWRDPRYEIFRWDRFPSLLIIDFADFAVQDRMLKRLAFYVEKAGFHGKLWHDEVIADLHGWNAHDYRAKDLARFFDTARKENFPLLNEEKELERILLTNGIIREYRGNILEGTGAILSISRGSVDSMRYRFMTHEGYHGIFYIDEEFQNFSANRWERFSAEAKEFLLSYFKVQNYDLDNHYLMVKEFNAHLLQQPVLQTSDYYGRVLAWRVGVTPRPSVVSTFVSETRVFSDYANNRWGFEAGRVWGLIIH